MYTKMVVPEVPTQLAPLAPPKLLAKNLINGYYGEIIEIEPQTQNRKFRAANSELWSQNHEFRTTNSTANSTANSGPRLQEPWHKNYERRNRELLPTVKPEPQIHNRENRTAKPEPRIQKCRIQNREFCTPNSEPRIQNREVRTAKSEPQSQNHKVRTAKSEPRTVGWKINTKITVGQWTMRKGPFDGVDYLIRPIIFAERPLRREVNFSWWNPDVTNPVKFHRKGFWLKFSLSQNAKSNPKSQC